MKTSRNNLALTVFGVVLTAVAGYFIYVMLAPGESVPPVRHQISTELNTDVLADPVFRSLRKVVDLPITATRVGWPNPFQPLEDRVAESTP